MVHNNNQKKKVSVHKKACFPDVDVNQLYRT